ncbi:MAG: hypothetical protein JJ971_00545 [Balneolaceae bacterium]|nr:hypothetical protein [Balneolaceae bacterium]MBO6544858.1 hypothetical protein [Balneolaceae bacterium]MBO6646254.1 hypothetical protein [Balneolaceae bacterium]
MKYSLIILLLACSTIVSAQTTVEDQIKIAILAAPEEYREGAKVYGVDEEGDPIVLREGSNEFVCVADNPGTRFQVSCYHNSLEPFMNRGRELRKEGKNPQEIFDIREEEAKSGTLQMPEKPAALHVYYGDEVSYNSETNIMEGAKYRYVVYIPFATEATTGIPARPNAPGHPWLMNPGTHRAHIMITPGDSN